MNLSLKSFNVEISNKALNGKNLPTKLKILSWGRNDTTQGPVFLNKKTLSIFSSMQEKTGRVKDVPIDFDHCSVPGSTEFVAGQPKSIAGYGDPVLIEGDGLYLYNIKWTDLGKENARNYKDLSPAAVTEKDGTVIGLHSVALTPTGAVEDLHFYSTDKGFEDMIKKMSTDKPGEQTNQIKKIYEKWPGNEGIKQLSDKETDKVIEHKDNPDCMCAECMAEDAEVESVKSNKPKQFSDTQKVEEEPKTKAMSAELNTNKKSFPDAYKAQMPQYNTMNDTIIKKMAAEIANETGMESSDAERVLYAFLANIEGQLSEVKGQITHKENTEDGGLKQFSAKFEALEKQIESLKNEKNKEVERANDFERLTLVKNASKEGKIIPLSAEEIKGVDINILRSIVDKQPKNVVPMTSNLRVLSVDQSKKPSRQVAVDAFEQMVSKSA